MAKIKMDTILMLGGAYVGYIWLTTGKLPGPLQGIVSGLFPGGVLPQLPGTPPAPGNGTQPPAGGGTIPDPGNPTNPPKPVPSPNPPPPVVVPCPDMLLVSVTSITGEQIAIPALRSMGYAPYRISEGTYQLMLKYPGDSPNQPGEITAIITLPGVQAANPGCTHA